MIKHVGFSLLDKFFKSFYPSKMRGNPMAGLLCNYLKVVGKGLGLWLRLGGGVTEGGKQSKQRSYSRKLSKSFYWEFSCQPLHDLVLTKPKFLLIFMRNKTSTELINQVGTTM